MTLIKDILNPESKKPTRDGFGKALLELGEENPNIWVLTADVSESTRTHWFAEKFPKRFVQVGVAEQNMAGVAAGIAACDKTVFISAFGAFSPGRNWDQIRVSICYNNSNVKIHASHTGLTVGPDGATHQALEDIAIVRSLPNITILAPADYEQALKATKAAAKIKTPCYIRTSREKLPVFTTKETPFEIGKANVYRDGKDVAIFAHGITVYYALVAAELLKKKGIDAAVIDCHTIKPIDEVTIIKYAKQCGLIVSVDDHQVIGGLGSTIAEVVVEKCPCPVKRHGIYDHFCESGDANELLKKYVLDADGIAQTVEQSMKMKK
ncbi:transketolase family protein [Candidatus Micrarchaeota archaeon]|nr:transketolase family protein [Candidatus Micrarchaeota archaeon]MBU1166409.1 transketolase family protein [Candidatus Micrarchaeota archaeon]MBU1886908.1 transketolase family protein [Candidatus Micrarchaeota archaeon]